MRKQRTREHIIEDLGFNHVERQILYAGYTVLRYPQGNDYSYDGLIQTFNDKGEVQTFRMLFQLKSTDNIQISVNKKSVVFDLSVRDLEYWLSDTVKMLLILYDSKKEIAYFVDLQVYFKEKVIEIGENRKFVRVHIPTDNVVTAQSFQKIN
jgi:Domain of unknown function (DUF4365)